MSLLYKISEAIRFIRYESPIGVRCSFSGGKDSIVIKKLVELSGVEHTSYYSNTGIDPPELVKFVREDYPDVKILRPRRSFFSLLDTKGPPSRRIRWCCESLKHGILDKVGGEVVIVGIRSEESSRRSSYERVNYFEKIELFHLYPILSWNMADVWEFIEYFSLSYCSLYDEGWDRLGCVICPNHTERLHQLYYSRWPTYFKVFNKCMLRLWLKRQQKGKKMYHSSAQDFLRAWYKDSNAKLYATSKGE